MRPIHDMFKASVNTRTLHLQQFSQAMKVPQEYLQVETSYEAMTHEMVLRMDRYVWAEELTQKQRLPATWWDMLKRDHAPAWFLKRFPVKEAVTILKALALFPDYTPPRGTGAPVMQMREVTAPLFSQYPSGS